MSFTQIANLCSCSPRNCGSSVECGFLRLRLKYMYGDYIFAFALSEIGLCGKRARGSSAEFIGVLVMILALWMAFCDRDW